MNSIDTFKDVFFSECSELLLEMEERLLKLSSTTRDKAQLDAVFRCAHSIKGGAGAFGYERIVTFTHLAETLLDSMRTETTPPSREAIDVLLKTTDIVTQMLIAAREGREPEVNLGSDVLVQLQRITGCTIATANKTAAKPAVSTATYDIDFVPHAEFFTNGNDPMLVLRELAQLGDATITADTSSIPSLDALNATDCYLRWHIRLISDASETTIHEVFDFVTHVCELTITRTTEPDTEVPAQAAQVTAVEPELHKTSATHSIRVDLDKIDRLVNMVGELVITEAMLRAHSRELVPEQCAGLLHDIEALSYHTRELQEAVMAVRMQPVKSVFSRMPRIVRDTAAQLGKEIQLVMSGENTEVDKTVVEQLADPLTHMIRNAVDHGIETPEQRIQQGKSARGNIHLSADHKSGRIVMTISDDGAGINRARVLEKAKEKGLVAADAALTDEEIDQLIFLPGFSTATQVTNLSGRGVGMDVVKRNIEALGGTVRVTSMPGQGSIFTVLLPLTLAILDGMIVRVGQEHYIIPTTSIIESLRPKQEDICTLQSRSDVIHVRGEFIPVIFLERLFAVRGGITDPTCGMVVLVEAGHEKIGIVVDELVGQQQVVIKSLEANSGNIKGISGATILGDGKVSLILDINELAQVPPASPHPTYHPSQGAHA